VLVIAGGVGAELGLRSMGYRPSVYDDAALWALVRADMPPYDPDLVAFVGSSKTQADVHLQTFAQQTGRTPVMLAIFHSSGQPVLQDLANDPTFVGDVVFEISPEMMFTDKPEYQSVARSRLLARDDLERSLFGAWEQRAKAWIQERLVVQNAYLDPFDFAKALLGGELPRPSSTLFPNRERIYDGTLKDPLPDVEPPEPSQIATQVSSITLERLAEIQAAIDALEARGCRVMIVDYPVRGGSAYRQERDFPRRFGWDLAVDTLEVPALSWREHPALSDLRTHDHSHLDVRDSKRFTRVLAQRFQHHIGPARPTPSSR